MIRGRQCNAGWVALLSQFTTDALSAPRRSATSLWRSPRSSRRFRTWSPKVRSSLGYRVDKGFSALRVRW